MNLTEVSAELDFRPVRDALSTRRQPLLAVTFHPRTGKLAARRGRKAMGPFAATPQPQRVARLPKGWTDSRRTVGPVPFFARMGPLGQLALEQGEEPCVAHVTMAFSSP